MATGQKGKDEEATKGRSTGNSSFAKTVARFLGRKRSMFAS